MLNLWRAVRLGSITPVVGSNGVEGIRQNNFRLRIKLWAGIGAKPHTKQPMAWDLLCEELFLQTKHLL